MLWGDEAGKLYFEYESQWAGLSPEIRARVNALPQAKLEASALGRVLIVLFDNGGVAYFEAVKMDEAA